MIVAAPEVMERNFRWSFEWPITNLMIGPVSTWIFCSPRLRTGAQKKSEPQICLALNSRWPTLWFAFGSHAISHVLYNRLTETNEKGKQISRKWKVTASGQKWVGQKPRKDKKSTGHNKGTQGPQKSESWSQEIGVLETWCPNIYNS